MVNGKTLYSRLTPDDVADYVVLCGDPWRVEKLAKRLDTMEHKGFYREFNTYTGTYKGLPVTISSTGMGSPSAIVALEELYECDAKVVVRMGTSCGAYDSDFGKYLIATGGIPCDGTSLMYCDRNYPAIVDKDLVKCFNEAVTEKGWEYVNGLTMNTDGHYVQSTNTRFARERRARMIDPPPEQELSAYMRSIGAAMVDMESAALIQVGCLMGIKVGSVCLATVNDNWRDNLMKDEALMKAKEDGLFTIVLEGLLKYDKKVKSGDV